MLSLSCTLTFLVVLSWKGATVLASQDVCFRWDFSGWWIRLILFSSHCTAALMFLFFPVTHQWQYLFCNITPYQAVWWRDKFMTWLLPSVNAILTAVKSVCVCHSIWNKQEMMSHHFYAGPQWGLKNMMLNLCVALNIMELHHYLSFIWFILW